MASRFWVGGTGTWDASDTTHWSGTSGGAGGQSVPGSGDTVTLDAASGGGTVTVATDFNVTSITMGAFTGTLDFSANNNSPTMQTFSGTGTGVRTLNMGSGTWNITGNGTTIWNTATTTNLTLTGSGIVNCTYSGGTGTRTFGLGTGGAGFTQFPSVSISAGTDTFRFSAGTTPVTSINYTGFSGIGGGGSGTTVSLLGDLTFSATMTCEDNATVRAWNFISTTSTQTLTTNGVVLYHEIFKAGAGGTLLFADNVDLCGASANIYTANLTSGTLNGGNKNVIASSFASNNSNTRTLALGSGTWTLTGTGTVWNTATVTNLTLNAGTSTIIINDASSSSKTFAGGVSTFYNLLLTGAGSGTFIVGTTTGTTTFNNITVSTPPHTVQIFAGKTIIANSLTWSGTAGNLNTFESTTGGVAWNLTVPSGTVSADYISLKDSNAIPGAAYLAGPNSVDVSGNTGWVFLDEFTLTYTAGANGVIQGTSPQTVTQLQDGSPVLAVPDATYIFLGWSDGVGTNPRIDTRVKRNISVTANFAAKFPFSTVGSGSKGNPGINFRKELDTDRKKQNEMERLQRELAKRIL